MIQHWSPSNLNGFEYDRGKWCLSYLFKIKENTPFFWRGKAVEIGFDALSNGFGLETAITRALDHFDTEAAAAAPSDKAEEQRDMIPGMVRQIVPVVAHFGKPVFTQVKTEHRLNGIALPFLMFLDFVYPTCVVELKTSEKCVVTPSHKRQGALYSDATGMPVYIVCTTEKKHVVHLLTDEEKIEGLADVRDIVSSINATLANRTPLEVLRACRLGERASNELKEARKQLLMMGTPRDGLPTVADLYGP